MYSTQFQLSSVLYFCQMSMSDSYCCSNTSCSCNGIWNMLLWHHFQHHSILRGIDNCLLMPCILFFSWFNHMLYSLTSWCTSDRCNHMAGRSMYLDSHRNISGCRGTWHRSVFWNGKNCRFHTLPGWNTSDMWAHRRRSYMSECQPPQYSWSCRDSNRWNTYGSCWLNMLDTYWWGNCCHRWHRSNDRQDRCCHLTSSNSLLDTRSDGTRGNCSWLSSFQLCCRCFWQNWYGM